MLSTADAAGKEATEPTHRTEPAMTQPQERCCHRCGRDIGALERVGRRDTCLHCGSDLHCCLNCGFYDTACHNQCREPEAERQVDKQAGNFCDYFSFRRGAATAPQMSAQQRAKSQLDALFGKRK
jgi:hypothetical protein